MQSEVKSKDLLNRAALASTAFLLAVLNLSACGDRIHDASRSDGKGAREDQPTVCIFPTMVLVENFSGKEGHASLPEMYDSPEQVSSQHLTGLIQDACDPKFCAGGGECFEKTTLSENGECLSMSWDSDPESHGSESARLCFEAGKAAKLSCRRVFLAIDPEGF